jgi:hypothetical protein
MTGQARMVKLCELWQRKSGKGTVYFSGFMGDVQVLLFKEGKKPHPTRPDEEVIVWKLFVQERDQSRRPQQRRDLPTHGGRQAHEATEERADNWWKRQPLPDSGDPGQHDTGNPDRPFDDEVPW